MSLVNDSISIEEPSYMRKFMRVGLKENFPGYFIYPETLCLWSYKYVLNSTAVLEKSFCFPPKFCDPLHKHN